MWLVVNNDVYECVTMHTGRSSARRLTPRASSQPEQLRRHAPGRCGRPPRCRHRRPGLLDGLLLPAPLRGPHQVRPPQDRPPRHSLSRTLPDPATRRAQPRPLRRARLAQPVLPLALLQRHAPLVAARRAQVLRRGGQGGGARSRAERRAPEQGARRAHGHAAVGASPDAHGTGQAPRGLDAAGRRQGRAV